MPLIPDDINYLFDCAIVDEAQIYHAGRTRAISAAAATTTTSGPVFDPSSSTWEHGVALGRIAFPLAVEEGEQIAAWSVHLAKTSATGTVAAELYEQTLAGGARTKIGATQSNGGNAPGDIALGESGLSVDVAAGKVYFIVVIPSGTDGDFTFGAEVVVARPSP